MSHSPSPQPQTPNLIITTVISSVTPIYIGAVNLRYITGADGLSRPAYIWETYQVVTPTVSATPYVLYAEGDNQ